MEHARLRRRGQREAEPGVHQTPHVPSVRVIPPKSPSPPVRPGWPSPPRDIHYVAYKERPSLLSSESTANSYRGFINLSVILLFFTNARLVVTNLSKYGLRFLHKPASDFAIDYYHWPALSIFFVIHLHVVAVFGVQKLSAMGIIGPAAALLASIIFITMEIVVPAVLVFELDPSPAAGICVLSIGTITMMKLVSYVHVNHNLRCAREQEKKIARRRRSYKNGEERTPPTPPHTVPTEPESPKGYNSLVGGTLKYPENVSLRNVLHYMMLPTLVYQLSYPRSMRPIRKGFLARRIGELLFFSALMAVMIEQYVQPILMNALPPMRANDIVGLLERLLKLAIPNLYVWLLGFYCFFHLYLNILAEIFHFADRKFYGDWWNATTVGQFWRLWNLPVHHWIAAHVFQPCVRQGISKFSAFLFSFIVSAVFHEYVVAIPFRTVKMWAFGGMLAQVPLVYITQGMSGKQVGNVIFWLSITLGQPFAILMYYRDFLSFHGAL